MIGWVVENKDWLFSGIGVALAAWLIRRVTRSGSTHQTQTGGDHSTNIQVGGSFSQTDPDRKADG